uniref:Uncharacterized protein n=1 Tax=Caenorhabditis japonica TaxID=281687 RepID=A0A8R1EW07_CAEJA
MSFTFAALLSFLALHANCNEIRHPTSDKIFEKYIDLSMNLTILFKDSSIEEAEIHE